MKLETLWWYRRKKRGATPPIITSAAPTGIAYGVAVNHPYTATGSTPITWSVTAGALPTGLSLNAGTGALTGTPTASGAFSWTVTATNTAGTALEVLPGFTVTTTGAATLTIALLTVSASTTVFWGDGNSDAYTGTGTRTHNYAGAGTWRVYFSSAATITALALGDNKITLNSAGIKSLTNITNAAFSSLKAGTFDSADVSAWRPTYFKLYSMPAGYAGTFDSADVSAWRPYYFYLFSMPAGYAGTLNSSDMTAWNVGDFRFFSMPAGYAGTFDLDDAGGWTGNGAFQMYSMPASYSFTVPLSATNKWRATTTLRLDNNSFLQATVDAVLSYFYTALTTRVAVNGSLEVGGNNAAPSGTLGAACPPTTGKEFAYELANDSCAINPTKKWAAVTITA